MKRIASIIFFMFISMAFFVLPVQAQVLKDEVAERPLERVTEPITPAKVEGKAIKGRWASNLRLAFGYETNPKLVNDRKGDFFESFRFNANYRKTFHERNQFLLISNFSLENYHEITDLKNLLGQATFMYRGAMSKSYIFGFGYDVSLVAYPRDEDTDYAFHKLFTNFQHRVTPNFYHQLEFNHGWKLYGNAKALAQGASTFQDNKRKDVRTGAEYSAGYTWTDRLSSVVRLKGFFNDSNANYQNFHDYWSYEFVPRFYYKINDQLSSHLSFSYTRREYTERRISSLGDDNQKDNIYVTRVGLTYKPHEQHRITLDYTHRDNDSSDSLSEYSSNRIEGGWQYYF